MRSPYSTPHIYGLERAISSPGVPFVVRHWPKGSRPLRKRSVFNTKSPWISALPLREVGYIKYIKYGNWITGWRLLSIILGLKTFHSWLILFPPLQAVFSRWEYWLFSSSRSLPCHWPVQVATDADLDNCHPWAQCSTSGQKGPLWSWGWSNDNGERPDDKPAFATRPLPEWPRCEELPRGKDGIR